MRPHIVHPLVVKGVDYLPKQTVSDALRSATNGRSYIVHVDGVKKMHAVGYVTKYLTKDVTSSPDVQEMMSLESGDQPGDTGQEVKRSAWVLYKQKPFSSDIQDYRARRQAALLESLTALQAGKSMYSRRVVSIWAYQRRLRSSQRTNGRAMRGE